LGRNGFVVLQFGSDDGPATVVAHGGGQMNGGDAERRAVFDDGARSGRPRQKVQQHAAVG
jgi:hypothetical protein